MRTIAKDGAAAWLVTFGLWLAGAGLASAQGAAEEPGFGERAEALAAAVDAETANAARLLQRAGAAEGDFAAILARRAEEAALEATSKAHDLAQLVIDREADGQDAGPWRARAVEYVESIHLNARRYLETLLADEALDASMADLSPAEQAALEVQQEQLIGRILTISDVLVRNLELSAELGADVADQEAYLKGTLADGAELLSLSLEGSLQRIDRIQQQLAALPEDGDLAAKQRIADARVRRIAGDLSRITGMLGSLEMETARYKQQLIEVTGDVTTDIFDWEVMRGLLSRWFGDFGTWLTENLPQFLFKLVLFLLVLWIALALSRVTRRLVAEGLKRSKLNVSQLLQRMIVSTAAGLVLLLGLLFGLAQLGISVGPALAGLGIAGFIVGFALQDTLGNFASGLMILLYRPYDVGDLIEAGGVFGKVSHMSLVNTTILTADNQTLVMPNSKIWGDIIKNVTAQDVRRVDMIFGIGYGDDIPKAEQVLSEIIHGHDKVLDEPEPVVRLHTLNESSVDFVVRPWVKTADYWDVYWDVTRAVKMRFDEEGISIPFPQRDVHVFSGDPQAIAAVVPANIEQGGVDWKGTDAPEPPAPEGEEGAPA